MKEKILYSIVSLFIGACVGGTVVYAIDTNKIKEKEDEIMEIQSVLDEGRDAMIKTNIYVNEFAKKLFISSFVDGSSCFKNIGSIVSRAPETEQISKTRLYRIQERSPRINYR